MNISNEKEKITFISKLKNKSEMADRIYSEVYSDEFYPPNIWAYIQESSEFTGVHIYTFGAFEESERRMICFAPYEIEYFSYPYVMLCIKTNSKFKDITHRDYLGSIMGLGIKREKIGDLVVDNGVCYVPVSEDISEYIKMTLSKIGNSPCVVEEVNPTELPEVKYETEVILCSGNRVDNFVSALSRKSRSVSTELIAKGFVKVNYEEVTKKNKSLKEGDMLVIKGIGKFKIIQIIGTTSKGRYKYEIKKFT